MEKQEIAPQDSHVGVNEAGEQENSLHHAGRSCQSKIGGREYFDYKLSPTLVIHTLPLHHAIIDSIFKVEGN